MTFHSTPIKLFQNIIFWMLLATFNVDILSNHYECNKLSNKCLFIYNLDTVFWLISQKKEAYKKLQGTWPCRLQNKVCQSFPLGNLLWHTSHWTWNDPPSSFLARRSKRVGGTCQPEIVKEPSLTQKKGGWVVSYKLASI